VLAVSVKQEEPQLVLPLLSQKSSGALVAVL
jgi:hypothetical protein